MARNNGTFSPLPRLDPADPRDRDFARREYHKRKLRLDKVEGHLKSWSCPLNPSWHATYCHGCLRQKPGHFNKVALQAEAEFLRNDVKELKCFLRKTDGQMDCN